MKRISLSLVTFLLLLVILGSVAFLFLDFHIARSQTNSGYTLSTASSGQALPDSMQNAPGLSVAVVGESSFSRTLRSAIKERISGASYIAEVNLLETAREQANAPYLFIDPGDLNILWTPVYARANLKISVAFASDGDMSFRGKQPIEFSSEEGQVIKSEGDFNVQDFTLGLISRPAYYNLLARRAAVEIQRALEPLFQPK